MTVGKKYTIIFHEDSGGVPVIDSLDFTGEFSYTGPYVSNVVVKKDDVHMTNNDRFIVTYYWAAGAGPNLGTVSVATLLADAVSQVNTVLPDDV